MCVIQMNSFKGQVAAEFLLYSSIFILVALIAFLVVNQLQSSELPYRQNLVAKETGESFANVILLTVKGGRGFSYLFNFPKTLFGSPYKITFVSDEKKAIILDWQGPYGAFSYSYPLPIYDYYLTGSCFNGQNVLVSDSCNVDYITLNNNGVGLTINYGG